MITIYKDSSANTIFIEDANGVFVMYNMTSANIVNDLP